jgi:hypothetical protein
MESHSFVDAVSKTAIRTGANYLNTPVYLFNSLETPWTGKTISVGDALNLIQEPPQVEKIRQARKAGKGSETYDSIKKSTPCFTWNVSLFADHYRKSDKAIKLSGLMYFDRDTAGDIQELSVLPELVCAWTSFGGLGDGFLVAVEGLTTHNFKSTWQALQTRFNALGLDVDSSCSNIDRANVLSYSHVLLADKVTPFKAVEPLPKPAPRPITQHQDADQTYTKLKKWLDNRGEYYADGNRHNYIIKLAAACNRFGIYQIDAETWMAHDLEHAASHVPTEEIRGKVSGVYSRYASDFNTQSFDETPAFEGKSILTFFSLPLNKVTESEYKQPIENKVLPTGKRLSDLGLDFTRTQYIDSPTATGKTAATILSGISFDMLVPTQDQAKQVGHEYAVDYVSEGRQPTEKAQQVGTYNALEKFVQRDVSGRTLVVDEAHNLALSQGYRGSVLNNILDQATAYKNFVLLSGTPVKSCHPLLKNIPVTQIKRSEMLQKSWGIIRYADKVNALLKRLERGKLNTVVLQDKALSQDLATLLTKKGYTVQCFNASTKDEQHHREIVEQCAVNNGIDVLIVTGLFFEGLNIYNDNTGSIHVLSQLSKYHIEQLFNRYRTQSPDKLLVYRSSKSDLYQDISFNWGLTQERYLKAAQGLVEAHQVHEMPTTDAASIADKILDGFQGEYRHMTRFNGTWQVNYLGVDYLTVQAETKAMYRNINLMADALSEYGFTFDGVTHDLGYEQNHELKQVTTTRKAATQIRQQELIATFEDGGMGYVIEAEKSTDPEESETAKRVLEIEKYLPFTQAIELLKVPLSDSKYKLLRDQVRVQKYLQLRTRDNITTIETKMLDAIYKLFQPGEHVTANEVRGKLNIIKNKHFKTEYTTFTNERAVRVLRQFFGVKRTSTTRDGIKVNVYEIMNTNPLAISFQTNEAA